MTERQNAALLVLVRVGAALAFAGIVSGKTDILIMAWAVLAPSIGAWAAVRRKRRRLGLDDGSGRTLS
jgi:hypothetical protein